MPGLSLCLRSIRRVVGAAMAIGLQADKPRWSMVRYQLRVSRLMSLEDVVEDLSSKVWFVARHRFDSELPLRAYRTFRKRIREVFAQHVKAFSLCGQSNVCSDSSFKLPWVHQTPDLEGSIYILELSTLDQFVEELAERSLEPLARYLTNASMEDTRSTLRLAFLSVLGEFLCRNAYCGTAQICRFSAPVNPWLTHP